jgi:hypothetical protein
MTVRGRRATHTRSVAYLAKTSAGDATTDEQAIDAVRVRNGVAIGADAHHLRRATLLVDGRWRIEHEWTWQSDDDPDELVYSTRTNLSSRSRGQRKNLPSPATKGA